jgi:radical SAM-linked protein
VDKEWLARDLRRALAGETLDPCGPKACRACGDFARECISGIVAAGTGRDLDGSLPLLATPAAAGWSAVARAAGEPPLAAAGIVVEAEGAEEGPRYRYRARFSKSGSLRFLGHLDLTRAILRGMRRARLALVYSKGFNPKPRVSFGPALPVGISSEGEYLDLETHARLDADDAIARLNASLPDGIRFGALREIRRDVPALGEAIRAARYLVAMANGLDAGQSVESFRRRGKVTVRREKKGLIKSWDLDEEILGLECFGDDRIRLTLALGGNEGSIRPDEVLAEIFGEHGPDLDVTREDLLLDWGGRLLNPLLAAKVAFDVERAPR